MMKRLCSIILAAALLLTGCAGSPKPLRAKTSVTQPPAPSPAVDGALTDMGLSLLAELRAKGEENPLLSPLSIGLALSMTANGADGDTLAELEALLGGEAALEELNAACAGYLEEYENLGGSTQAAIANSLWADPKGLVKDEFVAKCQDIFRAEVFQQSLSSPSIVGALNGWVSEKTNKLIPEIIQKPFEKNTAVLLVNALYLKNKWAVPFDPLGTYPMDFYHQENAPERMDFLNKGETKMLYISSGDVQGVVLPYDDGRLGFFALMPDVSYGLDPFLADQTGASFSALLLSAEETMFLRLALPKLQVEWSGQLEELLPKLGAELAFQRGAADFSQMGDSAEGYYISQVIHAAKIEVNEKGTEAAAATVVAAPSGACPPPEEGVTLILDHPFVYGICDLNTGLPLFLGVFA